MAFKKAEDFNPEEPKVAMVEPVPIPPVTKPVLGPQEADPRLAALANLGQQLVAQRAELAKHGAIALGAGLDV